MQVNGFWYGDKLGTMEKMCLNSYTRNRIQVNLYVYGGGVGFDAPYPDMDGMVTVRNAAEIVPESKVALFPWASIFSDYFRYALLAKKGGWWTDMDVLCLRELEDAYEYIFARDNIDQYYISGFMMRCPANAPIMVDAVNWIDRLSKENRDKLGHMDIGPYLLQREVPGRGLNNFVAAPTTFDPIPWNKITDIVDPAKTVELEKACESSGVIHLRQSIWNEGPNSSAGILPDGTKLMTDKKYPENSLWEILKRRYL